MAMHYIFCLNLSDFNVHCKLYRVPSTDCNIHLIFYCLEHFLSWFSHLFIVFRWFLCFVCVQWCARSGFVSLAMASYTPPCLHSTVEMFDPVGSLYASSFIVCMYCVHHMQASVHQGNIFQNYQSKHILLIHTLANIENDREWDYGVDMNLFKLQTMLMPIRKFWNSSKY